jgi:hypothetical protein
MKKTDQQLMKMILSDKDRYTIIVDNDAVWIQDNTKDSDDDDYWVAFNEYGYNLIPTIFNTIGVKSEFI